MAKIMYGSLAGAISGSLGNDVFSHGKGGAYVRRRVIPTAALNTNTLRVRNIMAILSRRWGALSSDQQAAWNTYAQSHPITDRLGQKQVLFGAACFMQLNHRLLNASDSEILLPPAIVAPAPLTTLTAVADASAHTVTLTTAPTPVGANYRLWIDVAVVNAPGVKYVKNLYKLVKISAKNQATALNIGDEVEARFGSLITTESVNLRVSVFDSVTGLLSGPKSYRTAVVA